jgi:hypothetical protein
MPFDVRDCVALLELSIEVCAALDGVPLTEE